VHCVKEGSGIVSSVDKPQGPIMYRLKTQFQPYMAFSCIVLKKISYAIGYAIRTCTNGKTDDVFFCQRLVIQFSQFLNWCICIGECLEISDKLSRVSVLFIIFLATADLLCHGRKRTTLSEPRTPTVAVYASSSGYSTIAIGAGESRIYLELVNPAPETVQPETL
jgi:hypothetical protein